MADRVCVMRAGQIEQVDTPSTLYSAPATPFVAEFVGTMNRIPGVIADDGQVGLLGSVVDIRTAVVGGGTGMGGAAAYPSGTPVDVLVRPEGLAVTPSPEGRGIVMTTTFLGSITRMGVLLDQDVMVYADLSNAATAVPAGSAVEVTLTERSVMVADRTESALSVPTPLEAQAPEH